MLQISINPGAPLGGSIAQNIPGNFDGYTFTPVDRAARINDFGKDNYAGQFFYGLAAGAEPISIAWASNWEYTVSSSDEIYFHEEKLTCTREERGSDWQPRGLAQRNEST